MSNDSQLEQFQREFRENVNKKLDYLTEKMDSLPVVFANRVELNALQKKVDVLETFKNKAIGVIIAVQVLISALAFLIVHFVR